MGCRIFCEGVLRLALITLVLAALAACATRGAERGPPGAPPAPRDYQPLDGPPNVPFDVDALPEPVPRDEPLARYGNHSPYEVFGKRYQVLSRSAGYVARGTASWYGTKFHGRLTSTREPYDMYQFSAAHKTLPLPSYARVTRLDTGKSVVVRINDRGPFVGDRLIDLSYAAAVKLGIHMTGTAPVEVRVLHPGDDPSANRPAPPTPDRAQVVSAAGRSYLQVAAFSSRANAFALRRKLQRAGFDAVRVYSARAAHGKVYRVRIGPILGVAQANSLRARLRESGFGETNLLQR
jgi:rare lipoprotein A